MNSTDSKGYLQRRLIDAPKGAVIDPERGSVSLWVVVTRDAKHCFSDLDDAQELTTAWNELHGAYDEARIRSVTCAISDLYKSHDRCRMVAVEIPDDLIAAFIDRCHEIEVNPSRLISGLILLSVTTAKANAHLAAESLHRWERGDRELRIPGREKPKRTVTPEKLRLIEKERQQKAAGWREARLRFIKNQDCQTCGIRMTLEIEKPNQAVLFQDGLQCADCKGRGMVAPGLSRYPEAFHDRQRAKWRKDRDEKRIGIFAGAERIE